MEEQWQVRIWGVRGAIPVPDAEFLEYGGNTSCISLECGRELVIFDAGSGLTKLGSRLRMEGRKRADILLSHLHMDHLNGLFGFPLLFDPEAEVHIYGRSGDGQGLEESLRALTGPPYWPLGFSDFPARIIVHEIKAGNSFSLSGREGAPDGIRVYTLSGNHPGGSLLYRVEAGGRSVICTLDCELDDIMFERLRQFARDGSLIIWDANFSEEDLPGRKGWGHSSWKQGIALRRAACAERILMTHYSWEYTDRFLRGQQELAEHADGACCFAKEGMRLGV